METNAFNQLRDPSARTQHKDLSQIAANQVVDGLPVINRTKNRLSPFADVVKTECYSENSGNHSGYSLEIEDDSAPTGYRTVGSGLSSKYLVLPNRDVYDLALEVAEASGLPYAPDRAYWDGAKFGLVISFGDEVSQDLSAAGDGSDRMGLSLVFRTSYDTSWRFEAALCGRRFFCDNLHLSAEYFGRVGFRHTLGSASEDWREVVRQGLRLVRRAPADLGRFVHAMRRLRQAQASDKRLREAWALVPEFGDSLVGRVTRAYADEEPTLFGWLQAVTAQTLNREKQSASDWSHNDRAVSAMVRYAHERLG